MRPRAPLSEDTTITLFPDHWATWDEFPVVETPVGEGCFHCGLKLRAGERGLFVPLVAETTTYEPAHRDCFLRALGVPTTPREVEIQMAQHLAQEAAEGQLAWWWLSFADGDRPKGEQFLGVAIVQSFGFGGALAETHRRKCNPGGEVDGSQLPDWVVPPPEYRNRLLTREEALACDEIMKRREP